MGVTNPLAVGHHYQMTATSVVNKFPIFMVSTDMSQYSLMW
jgi:citrate lyase synthetase